MNQKIEELSLGDVCQEAMYVGMGIDLTDCHYGQTTGTSYIARPTSYYYFLAGFSAIEKCAKVLEIGTNCGGSIMSINRGLDNECISDRKLATIDIACRNEEGLKEYPHITRFYGDSLSEEITEKAIGFFGEEIDLLYIDSLHEYGHTKKNIEIYAKNLNPRYIILDDIRQTDGMKKLWEELEEEFKCDAFDASEKVMRHGAGFGVIRYR